MLRAQLGAALSALGLLIASPAHAADVPVFSKAIELGAAKYQPAVVLGPSGDAAVAWTGTDGVHVARRPAGGGAFADAELIAPDAAAGVFLARNDRGDLAVLWVQGGNGVYSLRLAVAPDGGSFGPPEPIPFPERVPGANNRFGQMPTEALVAVASDGTVAVGYLETDYGDDPGLRVSRPIAVLRAPDGTMGPARPLAADSRRGPRLAADGAGGIYALWTGAEPGDSPSAPAAIRFAQREGDGFGAPQQLAPTEGGAGDPQIRANRRGDLIATWGGYRTGAHYPDRIFTALRPAGGGWDVQRTDHSLAIFPGAAINDSGDAAVAWPFGPNGMSAIFRPADGSFGAPAMTFGPQARVAANPVALDSLGTTIVAWAGSEDRDSQVVAALRRRGEEFGGNVVVSPPEDYASTPEIVTDPFGNGLMVWVGGERGALTAHAAAYSANPPRVSSLKVGAKSLSFRIDEPARVRVTLRRERSRAVSFGGRAVAGHNALAFSARARRLLRRGGHFRAVVRAADAGPTAHRRTKTFRRR